MKSITKNLLLSLLLGNMSVSYNLLHAEAVDSPAVSDNAAPQNPATVNEYIYGADSYAYTGGQVSGQLFVVTSKVPTGYKVGILAYKFKDSSKSNEWQNNLITLMTNATEFVKKKEAVSQAEIQTFNDYCDGVLDSNEVKFFPATAITDGSMTAAGYGCNFTNMYALINEKNEVIPGEWLHDPNTDLLKSSGVKDAEDAILFRWKNPEYKAPESAATCERITKTDENGTPVAVAPSLKTTETVEFKGRDFNQFFQVVASDTEVADNPEGLAEITQRVVKLFKEMPKVGATIIGRMVSSEAMAVCPITDEINGKAFNANISFDAGTTIEQAKELAEKLDNIFKVLKDKVTEEMQGEIHAETEKRHSEHQAKLAGIEEQERKAREIEGQEGPVNISATNTNDTATTTAAEGSDGNVSVPNANGDVASIAPEGPAIAEGSHADAASATVNDLGAHDPAAPAIEPVVSPEDAEKAMHAQAQLKIQQGVAQLKTEVGHTLDDMHKTGKIESNTNESSADFGATNENSEEYLPQGIAVN